MPVLAASSSASSSSSSISVAAISGIFIGTVLGGALLIALVIFLFKRYNRHKFTRVPNPDHPQIMSTTTTMGFSRHGRSFSTLSEPLISPASWPPLPSPSRRARSPSIPHPSLISFGAHPSGSMSSLTASGVPSIPPFRTYYHTSSESLRLGAGSTTPRAREASGDGVSPSASPRAQQTLFLHRMLQSRARVSEVASPSPPPSPDFSLSRSSTMNTTAIRADVERLIAEAERDALRDAERAEKEGEVAAEQEREDEWDEVDSESIYSQGSAPLDHATLLSTAPRRKSTRRRPRTPGPGNEFPLTPVTEMPDSPRIYEGAGSLPAANLRADGQGKASASMSSGGLPLLTSTSFGKESTSSGTPPGSISSAAGSGLGSSGTTSRYSSLAASSILGSSNSQPGPHADGHGGTDWHNTPPGLAGLHSLQVGPLDNPHSPVEKSSMPRPAEPRARLREGTSSSIPEVERGLVAEVGIASIDVAL